MKLILLIVASVILSVNTYAQCDNLPERFSSYNEAIETIQNTTFKFTDELPEGKSSWIASANYYSCDGEYGYLVYTTVKGATYIHEKVPKQVWLDFKNAPSSGSYYDHNIRLKYRLVPE